MIIRTWLAIIGAAVIVAAGAWWLGRDSTQFPAPGFRTELKGLNAEAFVLDASDIVRRGPSGVLVVRFASGVELVPHHFVKDGLERPLEIADWSDRLGLPIVLNAGQFDENLSHLGWLKRDGEWLVPHRHAAWQGVLLSGPTDGAAWARVADLDSADASVVERYRHALQSMMLVDDTGRARVRVSDKASSRTIIAEDTLGRILIAVVEGAVTLSELAAWLPNQELNVVRAMNLDGGIEAQIAIRTPELDVNFHGRYGTGLGTGALTYRLPAVIGVRRIASGADPTTASRADPDRKPAQ